MNRKASPLNLGGSCSCGQSEVPCRRVPALVNQDQGRSYKHALDVCADNDGQLSAEMCNERPCCSCSSRCSRSRRKGLETPGYPQPTKQLAQWAKSNMLYIRNQSINIEFPIFEGQMFSQGHKTHKTRTQLYFVCQFATTNYWLMISCAKSTLCKMLPKVLHRLK